MPRTAITTLQRDHLDLRKSTNETRDLILFVKTASYLSAA
jgi:hypothetical protein